MGGDRRQGANTVRGAGSPAGLGPAIAVLRAALFPFSLFLGGLGVVLAVISGNPPVHAAPALLARGYLPVLDKGQAQTVACQPAGRESYDAIWVNPPPTDRPAEAHADLNLSLRGYQPTNDYRGLVAYNGNSDGGAPQLPGLFADNRTATFRAVYRVYNWDWTCNCRGSLVGEWPVTLTGLAVTPGETIYVPESGYTIGSGYEVLVLYASTDRITLKYTREDNVVYGYTLQVENVCIDPTLLSLYQSWNSDGRGSLPALRGGQAIGRARGSELGVAIRDSGSFMDPRSRNDWWRGR